MPAHASLVKVRVTPPDASDCHIPNGLAHLARRKKAPHPSQSTLSFKLCGSGGGQCVCKHGWTLARANLIRQSGLATEGGDGTL